MTRGEVDVARSRDWNFSSEGVFTASWSTEDCLEAEERVNDGDLEVLVVDVDEEAFSAVAVGLDAAVVEGPGPA